MLSISQFFFQKKFLFVFTPLLTILLIQSCKKPTEPPEQPQPPPPPPPVVEPTLGLELDDAHCTETWILLSTKDLLLPAELLLKQYNPNGDSISKKINLNTKDTLLYIDSLYPNQTYRYQVSGIWYPKVDSQQVVTSNELTAATMDTTSSSFTFEMFTFGGEIGSSVLYDVAIINENNIWAVGDIWIKSDTTSTGYIKYNAVHWDGNSWDFKRLRTNSCGGVEYPPIKTILGFSADNILFAHIDGSITHFNGIEFINDCSLISQLNGSANKIWGLSKDDYYVVSGNGFIAHYNGINWTKIESGTKLDFHDIYGATDPKTGEQQILAVCSRNLPLDKGIYRIQGNTATQISSAPIQWELYALWFIPNRHYYVIGNGIYEKKYLSDTLWKDNRFDITNYATTEIRGNDLNDVFVSGAFGEFLHFNGFSWKSYINETGWFSGSYGSTAVKDNLVITVGYEGAQAKILMGYRQ